MQYTYRGAYLNALSEVIVAGLAPESALPVDAADVPLQRLVLPVGGDRGRGDARDDARGGPRARSGELIDDEGVTHYYGAPTVQLIGRRPPRAHRVERPVTALVAAAPPSPTLFARMAELNFRVVHVYGLTETYGPITVCAWQPAWNASSRRSRRGCCARQGQGYPTADLVRVVDADENDVPATPRRWARWSCAGTTS